MNNFCEECGNKINPGDLFCEGCGSRLPVEKADENIPAVNEPATPPKNLSLSFFKEKKPGNYENRGHYLGIIMTNVHHLNQAFGRENTANLLKAVEGYVEQLKVYGIFYLLLDVSDNVIKTVQNNDWRQHVALVNKAIKRVSTLLKQECHFLYILGGHEIIPMPLMNNPNPGSDKDLDSDLPYSSLSIKDPIKSKEARIPRIMVGRAPTGIDSTADDIYNLLINTLEAFDHFKIKSSYGLCAEPWVNVSADIYMRLTSQNVQVSPSVDLSNINAHYNFRANLHYFNLHGSNLGKEWVGQRGDDYPRAFSPEVILTNNQLNIIGVEACYGARFIALPKASSILLTALANKTFSFVGSSRVAWGPANPPMGLADVVIHDFLSEISQGGLAGGAFINARKRTFDTGNGGDPTSLASMMEFNLYGDPAFYIRADQKRVPDEKKGINGEFLGEITEDDIEQAMIDSKSTEDNSIYSRIRQAVDARQQQIIDLINKDVWSKYPDFKDIKPAFTQKIFDGKQLNYLTYKKENEFITNHLMLNIDQQGNIKSELLSK